MLTVTIYDFDNDGNPEMVYRDSQEVVVIEGQRVLRSYGHRHANRIPIQKVRSSLI